MSKTALEWALWLAERGFLIAPLPAGAKMQQGFKWKDVYTTDASRIRTWFECAPDMNYLVCPGTEYAIVDIDNKHGVDGCELFTALELENEGPATTFTVETASGGQHRYYRVDNPTGNGHSMPDGVGDLRGEGGYVVGPGSTFEGNPYTVVDEREPIRAPDWLQTLFKPLRERETDADVPLFDEDTAGAIVRARDYLVNREPAVSGDGGDEHTYVTFQQLKDLCISKERAIELVMEPDGWNDRCDPPWHPLELEQKANNAYRYGKNKPGSKGGGLMDMYMPDDAVDINTLDLVAMTEKDEDPFSHLRSFLLRGDDLWKADTHLKYVIPEWIPAEGYICISARRGVGKTTVMVDLASCISTDTDWHGWPVLPGYHVVYFCGEHDTVALQMLRAWQDHNLGIDIAANRRFIFLRNAGDLLDEAITRDWMAFLRQQIGPEGKAVVFVDTWQRATAGGGQSNDEDMQRAVRNADALSNHLGGPMIMASHPPKDGSDSTMGSSVIPNSSVAILEMINDTVGKRMDVTRMKGRGEGNYMTMVFEEIPFDEKDEHGRDLTGQAVSRTGGTSPITGKPDNEVDSPTAVSREDGLQLKREALGRFLLQHKTHIRSTDPEAKSKPNLGSVSRELERVSRTPTDCEGVDAILRSAGGDMLFNAPLSASTYENWLKDCFRENHRLVTVADDDGVQWDVGFSKEPKGRAISLVTNKTYNPLDK